MLRFTASPAMRRGTHPIKADEGAPAAWQTETTRKQHRGESTYVERLFGVPRFGRGIVGCDLHISRRRFVRKDITCTARKHCQPLVCTNSFPQRSRPQGWSGPSGTKLRKIDVSEIVPSSGGAGNFVVAPHDNEASRGSGEGVVDSRVRPPNRRPPKRAAHPSRLFSMLLVLQRHAPMCHPRGCKEVRRLQASIPV
jgi:hypothetical protein